MAVSPLAGPPALTAVRAVFFSAVLAVAAGGVAKWRLTAGDGAPAVFALEAARAVSGASHALEREAKRVAGSGFSDFDRLTALSRALSGAYARLDSAARVVTVRGTHLSGRVRAVSRAVDSQREAAERFKAGYAIARNARRYLPLASSEVVVHSGEDAALVVEVTELVSAIEVFADAPAAGAQERLLRAVGALRERAGGLGPDVGRALVNLCLHAEALLVRQLDVSGALLAASASGVEKSLSAVVRAAERRLGEAERVRDASLTALVFLAATFVVLWGVYGAARLRGRRRGAAPAEETEVARAPICEPALPGPALSAGAHLAWWAAETGQAIVRRLDRVGAERGDEAFQAVRALAVRLSDVARDHTPADSVDVPLRALTEAVCVAPGRSGRVRLESAVFEQGWAVRVRGAPGGVRAAIEAAVDAVVEASAAGATVTVATDGATLRVAGGGGGFPSPVAFGAFSVAEGLATACGATVEPEEGPTLTVVFSPVR